MFERFTKQARAIVVGAQREARALRHGWIGTEHVALALLAEPEAPGAATLIRLGATYDDARAAVAALVSKAGEGFGGPDAEALRTVGIDLDEVRRRAEDAFGDGALDVPLDALDDGERRRRRRLFWRRRRHTDRRPGHLPFASRGKKALELSLREALALKDNHIGPEHIALALLRCDDPITRGLLRRLSLEPRAAREAILADLRRAA